MNARSYYIYILSNRTRTVFYIGFTGKELSQRLYEHKEKLVKGFTEKYNVSVLMYYEVFDNPEYAIAREKQLKKWSRSKKISLIKRMNPGLRDLSTSLEMT